MYSYDMIVLSKKLHNILSQLICISPVKYLSSEVYNQQSDYISISPMEYFTSEMSD